jgi:hypothetical protein
MGTKTASLSGGSETVFVVDDEPLLVDICKKILELMGYNVIGGIDPTEALDILQDASIQKPVRQQEFAQALREVLERA